MLPISETLECEGQASMLPELMLIGESGITSACTESDSFTKFIYLCSGAVTTSDIRA